MKSSEDLGGVRSLRRLFSVPVDQKMRMRAVRTGVLSLFLSAGLVLLRGMSNVPILAMFVVAIFALLAVVAMRKYPEKKMLGIIFAVLAGLTFCIRIPGLRIIGLITLDLGIAVVAIFGVWKVISVIYSVFKARSKR